MRGQEGAARELRTGSIWVLIAVLAVTATVTAAPLFATPAIGVSRLMARAAPLFGYQALFLSIVIAAAPGAVRRWLGVRFTPLHHFLAKAGLLLLGAHAVATAVDFGTAAVLIPRPDSVRAFLQWGGSPALWLLLLVSIAAYFPNVFRRTWRSLHLLAYLAFYLGTAHGLMLGIDFQPLPARAVILAMVAVVTLVLIRRRWQERTASG